MHRKNILIIAALSDMADNRQRETTISTRCRLHDQWIRQTPVLCARVRNALMTICRKQLVPDLPTYGRKLQ